MKYPRYKYIFAIADYLIILFSLLAADYFINSNGISFVPYFLRHFGSVILFFIISVPVIFIFQVNNLYKIDIILSFSAQIQPVLISLFISSLWIELFYFSLLSKGISNSFLFISCFFLISMILILIFRINVLKALYIKFSRSIRMKRRIAIIGAGKTGIQLAEKLINDKKLGVQLVGFVDDNLRINKKVIRNIQVLGNVDEIPFIAKVDKIDEFIIAIDNISYERLLYILDICEALNLTIKIKSQLFGIIPQKIRMERYSGVPLIEAVSRYNVKFYLSMRRVIDILLTLIGIIVLMPVFIVIVILIKLSSPGNAFFKQVRIGKGGKPFDFYKFRTMTLCEEDDTVRMEMMAEFMKKGSVSGEVDTKIINNSRVTKIGRFLRKYSLDELPQLFNVLNGDMSLVGPRPCLPYEYELFDEWQKRKFSVLPGCTGIWQVTGRSSVSFNDSIVLDIYYINNMTPWLDMSIILKTIPVMLFAKGGK